MSNSDQPQVWYQGGVMAAVSGIVEDFKFEISEGSDQNWCFPDRAQLAVSNSRGSKAVPPSMTLFCHMCSTTKKMH